MTTTSSSRPAANIITNEEHQGTIAEVGYDSRRIIWHYGHYGVLRYGNGYLDYPDDAYRLPDGTTIVADIRNCRELFISRQKKICNSRGSGRPAAAAPARRATRRATSARPTATPRSRMATY